MILAWRETEIVSLVNDKGTVSVRELAELYNVADITIRRDLQKLDSLNLVRRIHGGAVRINRRPDGIEHLDSPPDMGTDALILAPVHNRAAHTLRERALRGHIPLIAELAPQDGAIYLGPDNFNASVTLGRWTARCVEDKFLGNAHVLCISLQQPNTIERTAGFIEGLRSGMRTAATNRRD